jgi:hypothetical protein
MQVPDSYRDAKLKENEAELHYYGVAFEKT